MEPPIPQDALERIAPVLRALNEQLKPLFEDLPEAPDSAIQFGVQEEM